MENQSKFLKVGNKIVKRQNLDGLDYELESGIVYKVDFDKWDDSMSLSITTPLSLPEKIYETDEDTRFINKVLNHFKETDSPTTGVLLEGTKGSGKTLTAKRLAINSNLPIISIGNGFPPYAFKKLFEAIGDDPVCIFFDELDKTTKDYDDSYLLKALDGADTSGKKLIIFTCNSARDINEYLKDRCSRIRYNKHYDKISDNTINLLLEDRLIDKTEKKNVFDFMVNNMKYLTYDNVISFIDEINENPNDTFEELFSDMNLTSK